MRCRGKLQAALILGLLALVIASLPARARAANRPSEQLSARLQTIRGQVMKLQEGLLDSLRGQAEARANLKRIRQLITLQKEEHRLGRIRMDELEKTIGELERRRGLLRERISLHKLAIRRSLRDLDRSRNEQPRTPRLWQREELEAPRRKVLANLSARGLREIEALCADLVDADRLEARIQEEHQQLAYLFHDMKEQEGLLELNRQLQADLLRRRHAERVAQLESYRKLKSAESQVETLIRDFNARIELERAVETEKTVSRAMSQGVFARLKGRLPLPADGKVLTGFGRSFDAKSNLYVFRKGVEIGAGAGRPVKAVSAGKIAYSGELAGYGRVAIIDHGDHFYTLCARLGELSRKAGEAVAAGDPIGTSDPRGTPVYFEIRARNIPVNPLQWLAN
jgi:septal ring factor EnvC (AmiA/AmiB activator)